MKSKLQNPGCYAIMFAVVIVRNLYQNITVML